MGEWQTSHSSPWDAGCLWSQMEQRTNHIRRVANEPTEQRSATGTFLHAVDEGAGLAVGAIFVAKGARVLSDELRRAGERRGFAPRLARGPIRAGVKEIEKVSYG